MLASHEEFETRVVPLVEVDGETVSSTRIRSLVAAGEVEGATPVPRGALPARGRRSSRATGAGAARLPDRQHRAGRRPRCPGHGVYAAFADGRPAAVNVGVRPTFETGRGLLVEAHLIDFDGDLYGRTLRIAFISRLRGERRFPGVEELIAQMHRDVEAARELCASFTPPNRRNDATRTRSRS